MDPQDLLMTAIRATGLYFILLFVVRVLGKREVGNFGAFDFIVALMLGEVVDEFIFGDVSVVKGLVAIGVVALWHYVNSWASFKSDAIRKLTTAEPTVLVEKGKMKHDALAKERMHPDEVWSNLRLQSVEELDEVKTATLEPNGQVSVLKQEAMKPLEKGDIETLVEQAKKSNGRKATKT
jgi:uncharacterized membrane protein YcaP (DUF421 family)